MTRDEIMALVNQTAGHHWMDEAHIQRFAALVAAAERKAIEPIVYGLCISDNNAQEIVTAIRKRGQG